MLKNYLKIAWKVLGRNKFFTFVSLFGISFTLAILIVVTTFYDHLLHPKYPEVNRDRCIYVQKVECWTEDGSMGQTKRGSFYFMEEYVKKLKTPELVAIASYNYPTLTFAGDRQLSLELKHSCENFWKVHEFRFVEGGPYTRQDINANRFVAVISEATRDAYFGTGHSALHRSIEVDKVNYEVLGVVENVPFYQNITYADLYTPFNTAKQNLQQYGFVGDYAGILLARNESDIPAIEAEFDDMVSGIEIPKNEMLTVLKTRTDSYLGLLARELFRGEESDIRFFRYLLFAGMFLFMLLPALNLVNLNSSRIMERASEIGVRKAFGATSANLTIQFIVENIVLSLIGGILGLCLGWVLLQVIESAGWVPHTNMTINFNILLVGFGFTLLFSFLSGVLPARRMSRLQIVQAIKDDL